MDTKTILSEASDRMQKTIEHLEEELLNIRAGKASPTVLNGVFVDYYGSQTPISGVASVTVPDAKTILIQPWDKNLIRAIEKAIIDSNITTLIAGLALLIFGSGPVRGFAVVHCLGILTSMFSAILVSRGLVNLIYGKKRKLDKLAIGQVWKPGL